MSYQCNDRDPLSVARQLSKLSSARESARIKALRKLWGLICPQRTYLYSAAVPSLDILALGFADEKTAPVALEYMELFAGYMNCIIEKLPEVTVEDRDLMRATLHEYVVPTTRRWETSEPSDAQEFATFIAEEWITRL